MAASDNIRLHRIGTSYDDGMEIVEDFVNYVNDPFDKELQLIVLNHYLSRARSYFRKLKDYLFGPDAQKDVDSGYFTKYDLRDVQADFPELEIMFRQRLEDLQEYFDTGDGLDVTNILDMFYFISKIFCMSSIKQLDRSIIPVRRRGIVGQLDRNGEEHVDGLIRQVIYEQYMEEEDYIRYSEDYLPFMFPLTNETGIFAINTYIYAFINKVFLIGVPIGLSNYDANTECPRHFIYHDIDHTVRALRDIDDKPEIVAPLYYAVVNDASLTKIQKEIHLFVMWLIIHESNAYFDIYNADELTDPGLGISQPVIDDFEADLTRFDQIMWTDEVKAEMQKIVVDTDFHYWTDTGITNQDIYSQVVKAAPVNLEDYPILSIIAAIVYSRLEVRKRYPELLPIGNIV